MANARSRWFLAAGPTDSHADSNTDADEGEDEDDSGGRQMTTREIDRILAATDPSLLPSLMRGAIGTVIRRGELCNVRWKHLDLTRRVAHLPAEISRQPIPFRSKA